MPSYLFVYCIIVPALLCDLPNKHLFLSALLLNLADEQVSWNRLHPVEGAACHEHCAHYCSIVLREETLDTAPCLRYVCPQVQGVLLRLKRCIWKSAPIPNFKQDMIECRQQLTFIAEFRIPT